MLRSYRLDDEGQRIRFAARLRYRGEEHGIEQVLLNVPFAQLRDLLSGAELAMVGTFGSFDGAPFAADSSFALIAVAQRPK
jgi:hypothetical protein